MPYKSDAQRRFFHAAEARGDISHETIKEFDEASKGKHLPEKVKSQENKNMKHGHMKHPKAEGKHESMDGQGTHHGKDGIPHKIHGQHGAAGSHEHTRHHGHQSHINTGHPDELEHYHGKMGKNG